MEEELLDLLYKQTRLVTECDLSDPLVQDNLLELSNQMQHKIINGR
ncbi:hypothetical protein SANA_01220 [Gottschalkiaceae bacterium SANA]|nr:hypothetical protein SANA_01220 [Gottschalkiaceae bacterium SANA]